MTTFAPTNGSVFDPFGHAMTTPCAALIAGRPCTTLQFNKDIFDAGLKRLSVILGAGKITKTFRSKAQKDGVRMRSMFAMYDETRTQKSHARDSDTSDLENSEPAMSPVTPRVVSDGSKCAVDGCLFAERNNGGRSSQGMYGHACNLCSATVHALCCQRVLKIVVEDNDSPLFCSETLVSRDCAFKMKLRLFYEFLKI